MLSKAKVCACFVQYWVWIEETKGREAEAIATNKQYSRATEEYEAKVKNARELKKQLKWGMSKQNSLSEIKHSNLHNPRPSQISKKVLREKVDYNCAWFGWHVYI